MDERDPITTGPSTATPKIAPPTPQLDARSCLRALLLMAPDRADRARLEQLLAGAFELQDADDVETANAALESRRFECLVIDTRAFDVEKLEFLRRAADESNCGLVVLTDELPDRSARDEAQLPAHTYVAKHNLSAALLLHVVTTSHSAASRHHELVDERAGFQSFVFRSAHDLRAPIRRIRYQAEMLQEIPLGESAKQVADVATQIGQATDELDEMIDAFVRYARADLTAQETECVELSAALRQAQNQLEHITRATGARIECGDLPSVTGRFDGLVELFEGLLDNALKFNLNPPHIEIAARIVDEHVIVTIRDNGIGIDPKMRQRIFLPFERLHGRSRYSGAGLGLATCQRIARAHGGEVSVESTPGVGSEFHVRLRAPAALASSRTPAA